ncbi:M60 family metallopeptidase [Solitalea sp. MAHUQ-68]|uniref:M60 family metallopeptidase n=1 Tax=Solitalea agri TaxID=2953739 RepID=A0A9X2F4P7_9SPHI|nr:M60 family metallopeptidase [Solitalea agri]MCO4294734.1 M60 family metallopeptidase [Solitalea agri]
MSFKHTFGYLAFLLILSVSSCSDNEIKPNDPTVKPNPDPGSNVTFVGFKVDSVLTVSEIVSAEKERVRLGITFPHTDFEPTGFYLPANGTLKIKVEQVAGNRLPKLMIGTYSRYLSLNTGATTGVPEIQLVAGENTIKDTKGQGGLLYFRYANYSPSAKAKVSFISGFKPVPFYVKGKTKKSEWLSMLAQLNDVPDVQLVGDKVFIVSSFTKALQYKDEDQDAVLNKIDEMAHQENVISGLDNSSYEHQESSLRIMMTEHDDPNAFMYAWYFRTAYTKSEMDKILTLKGIGTNGWGPWHEFGHMHQQSAWTWGALGEVTVNIYSLAVQRSFTPTANRLRDEKSWDAAVTYLKLPDEDKDFNGSTDGKDAAGHDIYRYKSPVTDVFVRLCMFQQLQIAFGDQFYISLHKYTRSYPPVINNDDDKMKYFMTRACKITDRDLSDFFKKWGLRLSSQTLTDEAYKAISDLQLAKPDRDLTLLTD